MDDQARALAIVAAVLSSLSGSAGFVGGRMTAPSPPAEVRFVHVPAAAAVAPSAEAAPVEPPAIAPVPLAPMTKTEPNDPAASSPPIVKPPLPQPRPKVDAKPKEQPKVPKPRAATPARRSSLPSCAVIEREYQRMTWPERMAAYRKATPEQIAQGKRCLGL